MGVGSVHGGRYELVRKLGTGGFGSVWQARDTTLLRDVAVKLIEIDSSAEGDARVRAMERFRREAQAIAGLAHPNVVTAFDFGVDADDVAYLVMELVNGKSLAQMAADHAAAGHGPLELPAVLRVADDVCAGLGAAHAAGLVHRDLKPANLMVCVPGGQVKIVDFGVALLADRSKLTGTGGYLGTLPYIAPEQIGPGTVDGRADIYSLGCVLHELLAGRSAFNAVIPVQWIAAHHFATPTPLIEHLPGAPLALSTLLDEMLAKDPERRPETVDVVRDRLAAITRTLTGTPAGSAQLIAATTVVPAAVPRSPTTLHVPNADPPPVHDRPEAGNPEPEPEPAPAPASAPARAPRVRHLRRRRVIGVLATSIVLATVATGVVIAANRPGGAHRSGPASTPTASAASRSALPVVATQPAGMPCNLKIAYVGTEHGYYATGGHSENRGTQLALAEYNAKYPSCRVSPVFYDTDPNNEATPASATMANAAQKAMSDPSVIGVVGPVTSDETNAVYPVLQAGGLPGITPSSTNDDLSSHGWTVFHRSGGPRMTLFLSIARWVADQHKKVYAIDDGSMYGKQLTEIAGQAVGAGALTTERINDNGSYSATVARVAAAAPGIVVFGGYATTGGKLLAQLRARGVAAEFVVGDLTDQPMFEELAGRQAGAVSVFCTCRIPAGETTAAEMAFAAAYRDRFTESPGRFADLAYDSTNMLLAGIMAGNFTRAKLNAWIGSHPYIGIAGSYDFTADGELTPSLVVVTRHPAGRTTSNVVVTVYR